MNRPARLVTAVLITSAALLLTACGGGDAGSDDNGKIAGADAGGQKTASPSASRSDSAKRPEIKLPSDVKLTFTPEETGNSVKDAILRDNAEFHRALDAAIVAQNPGLPALKYYTDGEGAAAAQKWVQQFKDAGWTVTGSVRYFNRVVKVKSTTNAAIGYCGDESKGYSRVIKTGELKGTKVTKDNYVAYSAQVTKNEQGVWQLVKITSTRGAVGCQA
ncbi:hypothetical protein [Streptomyces roseochromogenus]|uniref:Lipoprotein n=1 Tax=Streptomyces roseochromogenus subsp. oscitans DS 12.976 TaxID=1352936 RepID=V6KGJ5_STRRC|nr:hypothetical protein [Streptomyces roseochromogenus]EST30576.1 hypothetical protein M878_17825 [Streptomyces roseochromogenus subsp. oscitans DS 12.976]